MKIKKIHYKWYQFDHDTEFLKQLIDKDIKAIYGIPNGGLILAVKLSYILDVPLFLSLNEVNKKFKQNEILIVDDISDSGSTFHNIKLITNYKTASLFVKEGTKFVPTYYCKTCSKEEWIVFPWEKEDSETVRDRDINDKKNTSNSKENK